MKDRVGIDKPKSRRSFLGGAAAAGTALAIGFPAPAILAQTRSPIRVGLLNTFSGVISYSGTHNWNATSLYFDKIGWKIADRPVEFIKEDDQFNPQIGLQKVKKLLESDKVDLIVGPQASNVAMAVLNYAKETKFFYLVSGAGTSAIAWERLPYLFRSSVSGWQLSSSIADWCYNKLAKEMLLAADDFAGGHDVASEFRAAYVKLGGKVIKEIYPPLGTNDFSPYLTDIKSINPPATYDFFIGSDAVRFVKQYREQGIKGPITGFAGIVDPTTFEGQGDAALGVYCAILYTDTLDNPVNKRFAAEFHDRFKEYPNMYSEYGYTAAQLLDEAGKTIDGDLANKDKLAEAMKKAAFDAPRGPFRMDPETHTPIQNVYISEVKKVEGGRLANVAIYTYKDVRDPGVKMI
jgi:branched-chain amino acid transport system substrate-binding protein